MPPLDRVRQLELRCREDFADGRFLPYLQLHEFEALVLSGLAVLAEQRPNRRREIHELAKHLEREFESPEYVNRLNPPSYRIRAAVPEYQKATDGMIRVMVRYCDVHALAAIGEFDLADRRVAEYAEFSSVGQFLGWGIAKVMAGLVATYRGKFPDAVSSLEQALAALNAEDPLPWLLPARLLLARAYAALGSPEQAERVLRESEARKAAVLDSSHEAIISFDVEGRILEHPHGSGGFGYDPLFFHEPFGCTFGEASIQDKMKVSHRAQALDAMFTYLRGNASR